MRRTFRSDILEGLNGMYEKDVKRFDIRIYSYSNGRSMG